MTEPRTEAGRSLLRLWLEGRAHPPSKQRLSDFTDLVLNIEAEAADAALRDYRNHYDAAKRAEALAEVMPLLLGARDAYNRPTKEHRAVKAIVAWLIRHRLRDDSEWIRVHKATLEDRSDTQVTMSQVEYSGPLQPKPRDEGTHYNLPNEDKRLREALRSAMNGYHGAVHRMTSFEECNGGRCVEARTALATGEPTDSRRVEVHMEGVSPAHAVRVYPYNLVTDDHEHNGKPCGCGVRQSAVEAEAENAVLLRRLDAWQEGDNAGPLIRWAAAHLCGCLGPRYLDLDSPEAEHRLAEAIEKHGDSAGHVCMGDCSVDLLAALRAGSPDSGKS